MKINDLYQLNKSKLVKYIIIPFFPYKPENHEKKAIFIHIPKSAGSSLSKQIFNRKFGHVKLAYYEKKNRELFKKYYKFSFVRNPWSRFYSAFQYLKDKRGNKIDIAWANIFLSEVDNFEEFCEKILNDEKFEKSIMKWVHFIPQHTFLRDSKGEINIDFIGRFENINEDFKIIAKKFDMSDLLPKTNTSQRKKNYKNVYSPASKELVQRLYYKDIEIFDYEFNL